MSKGLGTRKPSTCALRNPGALPSCCHDARNCLRIKQVEDAASASSFASTPRPWSCNSADKLAYRPRVFHVGVTFAFFDGEQPIAACVELSGARARAERYFRVS